MSIVKGKADCGKEIHYIGSRGKQALARCGTNIIGQGSTLDIVHHHISSSRGGRGVGRGWGPCGRPLGLSSPVRLFCAGELEIVNLYDIGMAEGGNKLGFAAEA